MIFTEDGEEYGDSLSLDIWRRIVLTSLRDLAFKTNALNEYNPRVEYHVGKFLETLLATNGEEINCTPLIQTFTFDVYVGPVGSEF